MTGSVSLNPKHQEHQGLINRICNDVLFCRSKKHPLMLQAMMEHSDKEKRIHALCYIAKVERPGLATVINALQRALDKSTGRRKEKLRVRIVRATEADTNPNLYSLEIVKADPPLNTLVEAFWAPHVSTPAPVYLSYGTPLFWTDTANKIFFRDTTINGEENKKSSLPETDAFRRKLCKIPCSAFLAFGEAIGMLQLTQWFASKNKKLRCRGHKITDRMKAVFNEMPPHSHVIVMGAAQVNGVLAAYQTDCIDFQFTLQKEDITRREPFERFLDTPFNNRKGGTAYAIVSRRNGVKNGIVTMLASNNGHALQGLTELLIDEESMGLQFKSGPPFGPEWPETFQFLFEVEISAEEGAKKVKLVEVWQQSL